MIDPPIHVVILDDDPSIRTALVRLLTTPGTVAHACATSGELFEFVALKCPDCLVLDLQMPGMSGLDVLKYLNQRQIRIPTIVITGHDEKNSREACLNAGAVAYLLKPLDVELLVDTITNICGAKRSRLQIG